MRHAKKNLSTTVRGYVRGPILTVAGPIYSRTRTGNTKLENITAVLLYGDRSAYRSLQLFVHAVQQIPFQQEPH